MYSCLHVCMCMFGCAVRWSAVWLSSFSPGVPRDPPCEHTHTHTQTVYDIKGNPLYPSWTFRPGALCSLPGQGGKERPWAQLGWGRRTKTSLTPCSLTCCMEEDSPCLVRDMALDGLSSSLLNSVIVICCTIIRDVDFPGSPNTYCKNHTSHACSLDEKWRLAHFNSTTVEQIQISLFSDGINKYYNVVLSRFFSPTSALLSKRGSANI